MSGEADLDLARAEAAAVARGRALTSTGPDWGALVTTTLLAREQLAVDSDARPVRSPLESAARILDEAAAESSGLAVRDRSKLMVEAVVTFAMGGNFQAARGAAWREPRLWGEIPSGLRLPLVCSLPHLPWDDTLLRLDPDPMNLFVNLRDFLETGDERFHQAALSEWEKLLALLDPSSHAFALMNLLRAVMVQQRHLCTRRVLSCVADRLPRCFFESLPDPMKLLRPAQGEVFEQAEFLVGTGNATLSASWGDRALVAEVLLLSTLENRPGLVCWILPTPAAVVRATTRLVTASGGGTKVVGLPGTGARREVPNPETESVLAVMTPGSFDGYLRHSRDDLFHLRCAVFDGIHRLADRKAGPGLEGLLTRLRILKESVGSPRLLLMGPPSLDMTGVADWLDVPVPLRLRSCRSAGSVRIATRKGDDLVYRSLDPSMAPEEIGRRTLPASGISPAEDAARLAALMWKESAAPVLVLGRDPDEVRRISEEVSSEMPGMSRREDELRGLTQDLAARHPYLRSLRECLKKGTAYLHSRLPEPVKELLRRIVPGSGLRVLVATPAAVAGIEVPFETCLWLGPVLHGRPADRPGFLEFVGRLCADGRSLDVILCEDPEDPSFAARHETLISQTETRLRCHEPVDSDPMAQSILGSQLLGFLNENRPMQNPDTVLGDSLPARGDSRPRGPDVIVALESIRSAKQASGRTHVDLTPFGRAAARTRLSPTGAARLRELIDDEFDPGWFPANLFVRLCRAATALDAAPPALMEVLAGASDPPVRDADLEQVINRWLAGNPAAHILAELMSPKGTRGKEIGRWLSGRAGVPRFDLAFERMIEFEAQVFMGFLPEMCRAISEIVEYAPAWKRAKIDWSAVARHSGMGLGGRWALEMRDRGCSASRPAIAAVDRALQAEFPAKGEFSLDTAAALLHGVRRRNSVVRQAEQDRLLYRPASTDEISDCVSWLQTLV